MKPISCYIATPAAGFGLESYIENYCYLEDKYTFEIDSDLPFHSSSGNNNIYLWLPLILLLQSGSFCLPKTFWVYFGKEIDYIYLLDLSLQASKNENDLKLIPKIANRIQRYLARNKIQFQFIFLYLLTKIGFILISIGNLTFMFNILFLQNCLYPYHVLKNLLLNNATHKENTIFQTVIFCRVKLAHISSINGISAQCVLTGNVLYEKIFSLLWFMIGFCLLITLFDIFKWITFYTLKSQILLNLLKHPKVDVGDFCKTINADLFFILLMISANVNDIVAGEIIGSIYNIYKRQLIRTAHKKYPPILCDNDDYIEMA